LRERGRSPALLWEDRILTFEDLEAASRDIANGLLERGAQNGERVALGLPNSPELVISVLGVLRSGAALVPLNPAATPDELAHVIGDCGARVVITHEGQASRLRAAGLNIPVVTDVNDLKGSPGKAPPSESEDAALVVYTSGTTGLPKGVVLSHRALLWNLSAIAREWRRTGSDRLLLALPCFHLHGLGLGILGSLLAGSSIVLRRRFAAEETPQLLARYGCNVFFGVPTMYNRLVRLPQRTITSTDLCRMRLWVSGSAPLTPATHDRFRERFGYALMDRYGMTETGFVLSTPYDEPRRPGTVGRPLSGIEVRLVDPESADVRRLVPVPDGEIGEILVRGPSLFSGYWQRPEETKRGFVEGFFRSGDLAVRDTDGMYRIAGRRSVDIIKSGGFKIGAIEIESCIQLHPAVAEVAVVGVPDADRGETIVAVVTAVSGVSLHGEELRAFAREHLAPHKIPARFVFMDEIPRTGPGKFKKKELLAKLSGR